MRQIKDLKKSIERLSEKKRRLCEKARKSDVDKAKTLFLVSKWLLQYECGSLRLYTIDKELCRQLKIVDKNPFDSEMVLGRVFDGIEPFTRLPNCWLDYNFNRYTGKSKANNGVECELGYGNNQLTPEFLEMLMKHLKNLTVDQSVCEYLKEEETKLNEMRRLCLSRMTLKD